MDAACRPNAASEDDEDDEVDTATSSSGAACRHSCLPAKTSTNELELSLQHDDDDGLED